MADDIYFELVDRSNSLQKYDFFLKNMQAKTTIEKEVENVIQRKSIARILDLGCGQAGALKELKQKFGEKVFVAGIDLVKTDGLDEFVQGDAVFVDFPQNIDLIFSFRAMHEFRPLEKVFEKICGSLCTGGKAFLSVRCQQFTSQGLFFHGNMTGQDLDFLKKIINAKEYKGTKITGIEIGETKNIIFVDPKTSRKTPAKLEVINGMNFFIKKMVKLTGEQ